MDGGAWWAAVHGVAKSGTRLSNFTFTFHFHALEKEMATHSSILAWRIPGTGEPGGLPSMGSHRVGHDWSDLAAAAAVTSWWVKFTKKSSNQWRLIPSKSQLDNWRFLHCCFTLIFPHSCFSSVMFSNIMVAHSLCFLGVKDKRVYSYETLTYYIHLPNTRRICWKMKPT